MGLWLPLTFLVLFWWLIVQFKWVDAFLFPDPLAVFGSFWTIWDARFADVLSTLLKIGVSVLLGFGIGFLTGFLLFRFDALHTAFSPLMDFFRSIPPTALFPLFLLFFGIGDSTNVALAIWTAALYFSLHVSKGLRGTSEAALMMARSLKKTEWEILVHVRLKEALPLILVGFRTAVSLAIIVVVVTEMFVGTTFGIGKLLIDASYTYNIALLYAGILLIGIIGYALNTSIILLEKRVVHWEGK